MIKNVSRISVLQYSSIPQLKDKKSFKNAVELLLRLDTFNYFCGTILILLNL